MSGEKGAYVVAAAANLPEILPARAPKILVNQIPL